MCVLEGVTCCDEKNEYSNVLLEITEASHIHSTLSCLIQDPKPGCVVKTTGHELTWRGRATKCRGHRVRYFVFLGHVFLAVYIGIASERSSFVVSLGASASRFRPRLPGWQGLEGRKSTIQVEVEGPVRCKCVRGDVWYVWDRRGSLLPSIRSDSILTSRFRV